MGVLGADSKRSTSGGYLGRGAAVYLTAIGRYRLRFGGWSYDHRTNGELTLQKKEDRFIRAVTTHRYIQTQSGSGGGGRSSTHTVSSGSSHGGGSKGF